MHLSGTKPDVCLMIAALKSCASVGALVEGRLIHSDIAEKSLDVDLWSGNTLIDMYSKCNSLEDACKTFEAMPVHNVVSWNSLLSGFVRIGHDAGAAQILEKMYQEHVEPSNVTLLYHLKLCASSKALDQGKKIHDQVYARGLEADVVLGSALLNMYAKCNKLVDAYDVFCNLHVQNVVAWSVMIHGYAENGHGEDALKMFVKMRSKGIIPDEITFECVLKACGSMQALEQGHLVHIDALKSNFASGAFIGSILIAMYIKCGSIVDAQRVFDTLPVQNVVSWSCLIGGYAEHGQADKALELFKDMHQSGIEPNKITLVSSIKACANLGATEQGKLLHESVIEQVLESESAVINTLIDMYTKGGSLMDAIYVFKTAATRNVESWSALISGYANHGNLRLASRIFQAMCEDGVDPDFIAFLSLFYACSHVGSFEEAYIHLNTMVRIHKVVPLQNHFACMVDMFCRAGLLNEAGAVSFAMPFLPESALWKALLSSCVRHSNVGIGRRAFEFLLDSNCKVATGYVLMANVHIATIVDEDG